jgi:hypothetical protein
MASCSVERARGDEVPVNFVKIKRHNPHYTNNKIITYVDSDRKQFQLAKTAVRFITDPEEQRRRFGGGEDGDRPKNLILHTDVNPEIQTWVDQLKARAQAQIPELGPGFRSPITDSRPRRDGSGFFPSLLRLKCNPHTKVYVQRGDELRSGGSLYDIKRNCEVLCVVRPMVWILPHSQGLTLKVTDVLVFEREPDPFPFLDFGDEPVAVAPIPVPSAPPAPPVPARVYVMGEECSVCCDAAVGSVILPCAHVCMCYACARRIKSSAAPTCPMCRARITTVLKFNPSQ